MLSRFAESFARVVVRAGGMVMPATHSFDEVGGGGVTGVTTLHYHLASMAAGGRSSGGGATPDGDVLSLTLSEQIASMNRL